MKICFIGSGVEREDTHVHGIEVASVARVVAAHFDTLVYGGSSVGLMGAFASAFALCGRRVLGVVPRWLEQENLVHTGCELVYCQNLAERKHLMFEEVDAILCYPGGVGTWDELFDLLARHAVRSDLICPPVYLYNWEKYYAALLLQLETAVETGLLSGDVVNGIRTFETVEVLAAALRADFHTTELPEAREREADDALLEGRADLFSLDQETPARI